jgi:DNA-binding transcriptional LysR family regulator
MDLDQLEVLVTVSQERSFSRAAVRLHRTQSAVSQAIRRLEGEIGESLVDRSSKTGTLTDAGRVLEEYGQRMLSLRREARTAVQELGNLQRGRVSVAVNEHTVMHLVPILACVRARYPQLHVEARRLPASQIPAEVLARGVEIGAVTYRPAQAGLAAHRIATDELVLVAAPGHALAHRRQVSLRDLGDEPFFAHAQRSPYRERVVRTFERQQVPLRIVMELPTLEAIKRLVELGLGLAILPRLAAAAEVRRGELAALPIRELRGRRPVYLLTRAGAELSHAARAFFECARLPGGAGRGRRE